MDPWQQKHITKHLSELIKLTKFNDQVLASLKEAGVLLNVDGISSTSKGEGEGNNEDVHLYFDMLKTRRHAYKWLGKAVFVANQNESFKILLMGLLQKLVQQSGIPMGEIDLLRIIEPHKCSPDSLKFFLSQMDQKRLLPETIPASKGDMYISRYLSNRLKVDPAVFKQEDCPDVFVFKNMKQSQLSQLASPHVVTLSRDQLLHNEVISRFILLEDHFDKNWEEIKKICTQPVHLIYFDEANNEYIYEKTSGGASNLKLLKGESKNKGSYISELQFLEQIDNHENRRVVCVCDKSGMGKSWLLQKIARAVQERFPHRLVVHIELADFVTKVKPPSKLVVHQVADVLGLIFNYLDLYPVASSLLVDAVIKNNARLELFLDGFDEIPKEHLNWTTDLFKTIRDSDRNTRIRLVVTSRPHMRKLLEETLGVLSYHMLPFSLEDQVQCLVTNW